MDETDRAYCDALVVQHRRMIRASIPTQIGAMSLTWYPRVRDASRARDWWRLGGVGLAVGTAALSQVSNYRRAELKAAEDLAREQQNHRARVRAAAIQARGETMQMPPMPPGVNGRGCVLQLALMTAGYVQGIGDFLQRPDRGRSPAGPRWRWRPGPAWWTAWSFQQLPVNAASTAARHAQIAYQRRQLVTLQTTSTLASSTRVWTDQLLPAYRGHEWLRMTSAVLSVVSSIVNSVQDYRRVPAKVDAQRARRRRHDAAVAALELAHAAGRPGPTNPWRTEIAVAAATTLTAGVGVANQIQLFRRRPKLPDKYRTSEPPKTGADT